MTQKNGTIEFTRGLKQAACVYNPMTKKLMKFNKFSDKYFTADPSEIKILDKLGYERSCVKLDGVKVDVESLSEADVVRVMRALELRAEKLGVDTPEIKVEDTVTSEAVVETKEEVTVDEEIKEEDKEEFFKEKEDKRIEKVIKKNKLSSKLAAEIGE